MRGYGKYLYYVWQKIDSFPAEEREIATEWRKLAVQVNEARTGGLIEGYLVGAVTFAATLIILEISGKQNSLLLGMAFVLSMIIGLVAGMWIHRKKYVVKTNQAVQDVKAKLADPVYFKWWSERMLDYDHEGYSIIANIADTSE